MAMPVTIISVAYNSEKTIARAIESVLNQTYENGVGFEDFVS